MRSPVREAFKGLRVKPFKEGFPHFIDLTSFD